MNVLPAPSWLVVSHITVLELITQYNMVTALTHGIPTYEMATSRWTCLDNVWCRLNHSDPVMICDVHPSIRLPLADHLLIYTELDLQVHRANTFPSQNMCDTYFDAINKGLRALLPVWCPTKKIHSAAKLEETVDKLVGSIQEVVNQNVPITKPSTYMKRWWSQELTELKKEKNKLSKTSYKFRGIPDHPPMEFTLEQWMFMSVSRTFKQVMLVEANVVGMKLHN